MTQPNKPTIEEAMIHFGAKGMHWGIRKAEDTGGSGPSSRDQAKQAKRETKAQTFDIRAAKSNVQISALNKELDQLPVGLKTAYKRAGLRQAKQNETDYRDRQLKDAAAVRQGHMTSTQKKLVIGGIAIAGIAGYMAYNNMNESGQLNSLKLRGAAFMTGQPFEFKKDASLSAKMSPAQVLKNVVKDVNPNYSKAGGKMNCRRSTFAYELRRRGFDVHATTSEMGYGQSESGLINALSTKGRDKFGITSVSRMIVGGSGPRGQISRDSRLNPAKGLLSVKIGSVHSEADAKISHKLIADALKAQPNGSRGEILFNFRQFGHSMAYEVFDGKPVIFDSQKGVKYDMVTGLAKLTEHWGHPAGLDITRLDNIPLDMNFLSRWATNN